MTRSGLEMVKMLKNGWVWVDPGWIWLGLAGSGWVWLGLAGSG